MRNVRVFTRGNVFVLLEHTPNPYTPYAGVYGVKRVYAILSIDNGSTLPICALLPYYFERKKEATYARARLSIERRSPIKKGEITS